MPLRLGLRLPIIFSGLNLVWEALQLPLYTLWWSDPWSSIIFAFVHCTVGDLMIGSVAPALAVGIAGQGWPDNSRARLHVLIINNCRPSLHDFQ